MNKLTLVSHLLCPYVQRAVIVLNEKNVSFEREDIDLAAKPEWFLTLSPTGKVPVLLVNDDHVIFESAIICEYLEEVTEHALLPKKPEAKAVARSWIEFASMLLSSIGRFYSSKNEDEFNQNIENLQRQLYKLERFVESNWSACDSHRDYFNGKDLTMVDAAFAPVFRYFEVFKKKGLDVLAEYPVITRWQTLLQQRPSVEKAVASNYEELLFEFILRKNNYFSKFLCGELSASNY